MAELDNEPETQPAGYGEFRTTHWSVVLAAGRSDSTQAQQALAQLCQTYWQPVYSFIRRRGHDAEQAKDLTQEVFARMIAKDFFQHATQARGRFRSFLLSCVQHFLNHEWKKEQTLKRGGHCTFVSWDDTAAQNQYAAEAVTSLTPEMLYERRWAMTLLEQTLEQLQKQYADAGKAFEFAVLHVFLSGAKEAAATHAEVAVQLGMSEETVRKAAQRLRFRYRELLRLQVAQTVADPAEVEPELAHLWAILSR